MLESHEKFHSANGKRQILVADDELINRELLGKMLDSDFEVLFACDGAEALEMARAHKDTLSLILLDIVMPVMTGLEMLEVLKDDHDLMGIPVIVTTSEKEAELESLNLGAVDFIPKPYPANSIVTARVRRIVELSEDREIIMSTERDELTGLYNKEYFYRYVEQFDQHHKDFAMDAVMFDVNHFHMINERYGRSYGDQVLRKIGEEIKSLLSDTGSMVCRREADTFMAYCPHRDDYDRIIETATARLAGEGFVSGRVHLRMGIYANVDKSLDAQRRFDRAKLAADTVKGSFTQFIGIYDRALHEQQLYAEQLIEDFPQAIAEKQFAVFYQPKFDVSSDVPVLTSAEALVRWIHPELGMISPGVFIPLFEDNGLIQRLDSYVWRETARQIADWKSRLGCSIPVSVNVSRIDMYDPKLVDNLDRLMQEFGLTGKDLLLEVTESAYTQDSTQIIEVVNNLRSLGFKIEMDDFGTGYSSLNMISALPIDALKLDMRFIRDAFREGGSTHMLEVIIGIADYLSVPVIAEGVETAEQLHALKTLGCDIVQGYFFSRPVPVDKFEPFILQKKEADLAESMRQAELDRAKSVRDAGLGAQRLPHEVLQNMTSEPEEPQAAAAKAVAADQAEPRAGIQLKTASILFVIVAFVAAAALIFADIAVARGYQRMADASDRYIAAQFAASNMESGSDYLTDRVRCFVVTGDIEYLEDFFEEIEITKRRDKAVDDLEVLLGGSDDGALENLSMALALSNELVGTENRAMRLMVEARSYPPEQIPDAVMNVQLSEDDLALSPAEQQEKAQTLVFDNSYMHYKDRIRENVNLCTQSLIRSSSQELERASTELSLLVNLQTTMTVAFLLIVLVMVLIITWMIRRPLSNMVKMMQSQEPIPPTGVEELRFVTRTYNQILEENREARERLSHQASHDALTGLFNRGAYDLLMESADTEHMALLLIDVDNFKGINDAYGHAVGDRVLKRVADILRHSFRSVDILCRIGGDEFAVVMTRVNSSMGPLVMNKMAHANELLQNPKDDLPPVSLSIGVAFSDRKNPQGDIFSDADAALYKVKEAGRNGCAIYE